MAREQETVLCGARPQGLCAMCACRRVRVRERVQMNLCARACTCVWYERTRVSYNMLERGSVCR